MYGLGVISFPSVIDANVGLNPGKEHPVNAPKAIGSLPPLTISIVVIYWIDDLHFQVMPHVEHDLRDGTTTLSGVGKLDEVLNPDSPTGGSGVAWARMAISKRCGQRLGKPQLR